MKELSVLHLESLSRSFLLFLHQVYVMRQWIYWEEVVVADLVEVQLVSQVGVVASQKVAG